MSRHGVVIAVCTWWATRWNRAGASGGGEGCGVAALGLAVFVTFIFDHYGVIA